MGLGPRSSQYFYRLFQNDRLKEAQTATSRIELEKSAASAFPLMLDFVYDMTASSAAVTTTETAVALRYLANYFDIPTLLERVNRFIERDLKKGNIDAYAQEAKLYQDDEIIEKTMKRAAPLWRELLIPDAGNARKKCKYMEALPESKHGEMLELFMSKAGHYIRQIEEDLRKERKKFCELKRLL